MRFRIGHQPTANELLIPEGSCAMDVDSASEPRVPAIGHRDSGTCGTHAAQAPQHMVAPARNPELSACTPLGHRRARCPDLIAQALVVERQVHQDGVVAGALERFAESQFRAFGGTAVPDRLGGLRQRSPLGARVCAAVIFR